MSQSYIQLLASHIISAMFICTLGSVALSGEQATIAQIDSMDFKVTVTGNSATVRKLLRVTINKQAGSEYGEVLLYSSPLQTIESFSAKLIDASGKQINKWDKADLVKACGFGTGLEVFSDNCQHFLSPEHSKFPYTVEYVSVVRLHSLFMLPSIDLDVRIPIKNAVVTLEHPADRPIRFKSYLLDVDPSVAEKSDRRIIQWQLADLPSVEEKVLCPPECSEGRHIAFAAERFKLDHIGFDGLSWRNIGAWYRGLSSDPDHLQNFAVTTTANSPILRARADSIFSVITERTRYVAAYLGIGGWQPHPLKHIRQRNYGDCKDLTSLLLADFHAQGITAFPCLLMTTDAGATDSSFIGFRFNHVITMALIAGDSLWYDPTCDLCPPGQLPAMDQGALAVVATDTGGVLVRVPFARAEKNQIVQSVRMRADSAGNTSLEVSVTASGDFALRFRNAVKHKDRKEIDQFVKAWLVGARPQYKVSQYTISNEDDINLPVRADYILSCDRPLDMVSGTRYLLPFLFTSRSLFTDPKLDKRNIPLWLGYPWQHIDTVIVSGPLLSHAQEITLPVDTTIVQEWGKVEGRFSRNDSTVTACLTQTYSSPSVPVESFQDFKSFQGKRRWLVDQPIKFVTKTK